MAVDAGVDYATLTKELDGLVKALSSAKQDVIRAAFPSAKRRTSRNALKEVIEGALEDLGYLSSIVEEAGEEYGQSKGSKAPAKAGRTPAKPVVKEVPAPAAKEKEKVAA